MPATDSINVKGIVVQALPEMMYRVELANGHRVLARVSSELRLNFIKILPGEQILVEFSPYDLSRGRIVERLQVS